MKKLVLFLAMMCACFAQAQTSYEDLPEIGNISDSSVVLKISPNPVEDEISIEYKLPKEIKSGKITFSDLMGNPVPGYEYKIENDRGTLKVPVFDLMHGIYFCRLAAGNYVKTTKFIVR